jgi:outer membrane protein OmpA-like peptidoglycan-associated protein
MSRALVATSLLLAACGLTLQDRAKQVGGVIDRARDNGAYKCAPRELAMAESHHAFAKSELQGGHYYRALAEVEVAEDNARLALARSPRDKCAGIRVVVAKDRDLDGILDKVDRCPDDPEDKDGFEDEDGCPDPDNDNDGIADRDDKCPNEAEDKDGFQDEDGCPDADNDKDGLADAEDRCPNEAGPADNQGCPDRDKDGDTVVDRLDKCPEVPGEPDNDGCPKQKYIVVTKEKIELKQKIHFATASAKILPDSFAMMNEIAEVLRKAPQIKVRIEGHTDSRGKLKYNMKLSQSRADSVKSYLVNQGVEPERMEARGFGPTQAIADNRTAAGREQNRRVEFIITSQ